MRVFHISLGYGKIIDERYNGMEYLVEFSEKNLRLWVKRKDLKFLDPPPSSEIPQTININPMGGGDLKSRSIVELLKLGIVPSFAVAEFTFGRDEIIERFKVLVENFNRNKGDVVVVIGDYGSGKTHILNYFWQYLLNKSFGVTYVSANFLVLIFSKPLTFYSEAVKNFKWIHKGEEHDFEKFLNRVLEADIDIRHPILTPFFKAYKKGRDRDLLLRYIRGDNLRREHLDFIKKWYLPVLLNHRSASDIYTNLLSCYGFLLEKIGSPGLAIIIDEAEEIFFPYFYDLGGRKIAYSALKGLILAALSEPELTRLKLTGRNFFPVGKEGAFGLIHSGVRPMPYLFQVPSRLFLILGITPRNSWEYEHLIKLIPPDNQFQLTQMERKDGEALIEKLLEIYSKAFPQFELDRAIGNKIKNEYKWEIGKRNLRLIIREIIDFLDLSRHKMASPRMV